VSRQRDPLFLAGFARRRFLHCLKKLLEAGDSVRRVS
jgi:hypothetical protein